MGFRSALRALAYGPAPYPAMKATTPPPRLLSEALGMGSQAGRQRNYQAFMETLTTIGNVYAAASVIAYNFAASPLTVQDEAEAEVAIREHIPALYALLKKPNQQRRTSGFAFRELLCYDMLLTGNAIAALDSFDPKTGCPTELFRLRPDWVRIVATSDGQVYYGYSPGGYRNTQEPTWYAEDEILHGTFANPLDDYWGLGIIEAAQATIEADKLIQEFKRQYFDRGAILEGILTTDQVLTPAQSDDLRTMWRAQKEGGRNRFRTAVLGQGTTYQPIQEPLGNIKIDVLARMSKEDVFALFGVPLQLAGDFSTGNYHNSEQALSFFYQNTMAPLYRRFEGFWAPLVDCYGAYTPHYEDRTQDPDFLDRAKAASLWAQTGALTRNMLLEYGGFDALPDDDPRGDVFLATAQGFQEVDPDQALVGQDDDAPTPAGILLGDGTQVAEEMGHGTVSGTARPGSGSRDRGAGGGRAGASGRQRAG
jgi:HK97 family phage portal protein